MSDCPLCGGAGWLRLDVKDVYDPQFGKAIPCKCNKTTDAQTRFAAEQTEWTLANFPGDAKAGAAAKLAVKGTGLWIFWSLAFGTGKTGLLIAMVNGCEKEKRESFYRTVPELLDELRKGYSDSTYDDLMQYCKDVPVLALDEFHRFYQKGGGAEGSTSWASEKLFQIIDHRYQRWQEKLTLIATNTQPDKGANDPLVSRFCDSLRSHIVRVSGGDMRPLAKQLSQREAE